ncbi:MAG: hypothetical protein EOO71_02060 [Myxococcaceae bacterium]|nr:MAG: hypothetical protein EOO71_02060 [Myxococcaceae bacterium]
MSQDTLTGTASVSSSLMYNYLAATSVDAAFPLASAEDSGGSPLLFSVGASAANTARKTLWVMLRDTTVTTGWRQVELSPDANHDVQGYAVVQAPSGALILAVALDDGAGGSRVYVSPSLTPTQDGAPWNTLNTSWVQRQGAPSGKPVQRLLMGDFTQAGEAPLLVAELHDTSGTSRYFVDASTSTTSAAWTNWAPPKDVKTLHDVVVARAAVTGIPYRGTWTLYDDTSGKRPSASMRNAKSTALAIASTQALSGVTSVLAQQDSSRVSVWAVDGSQRLFTLNNAVGATDGWSLPLQQREHVARLAPRRNQKRSTGELFVASTDNSAITYLWQDPSTTTWQGTDMVLPALADGQEFPSYTTVVRFTDAQGAPIAGQTVQVNASEWSRVMVNGYWTDLDDSTRVEVKTDGSGTLTLINKVSDVGTPVFHFTAPFLASTVTADPSAELRANLTAKLKTQDLSQWTKPDGTPVVPPGADPDMVAQVQATLKQLMDNMDSLPSDGSEAPLDTTTTASPPTAQAKMARTTSFSVLGDVTNAVETAAGDVLQALKSAAGAVYDYVLQPILSGTKTLLQFFVKLGEQVVTFVVRTVKEALQLISWLFQQLEVLIEDIIQFLGFLFAWDDILATQKAIESLTQNGILGLAVKLKGAEPAITQFFDDLIAKWDGICDSALSSDDVNPQQVTAQTQAQATPTAQSAYSTATTNPGATFSQYQVTYGGMGNSTPSTPFNPVAQAITDLVQTVGNMLNDVGDSVKEIIQGLQTMFQQGTFSLHAVVNLLAGEAAKALLGAMRDLLLGFCDVVADLAQAVVQDVLLHEFDIPVISWLYKKLTGEDSLTMLGAVSLLAAIPVTIVYKLLTGEAPVLTPPATNQLQFVAMPWQARKTTRLDVKGLEASTGPGAYDYSVIGGGVAEFSSLLYTACLETSALIPGSRPLFRKVNSTIMSAATSIGVVCTFPFDASALQQFTDLVSWCISLVEAFTTCGVSLLSWMPPTSVDGKLGAEVLEQIDTGLLGVIGIVGLILSVASYVMELETLTDDDVPVYHGFGTDTEKLVANLLRYGGACFECIAGFIPSPAKEEAIFTAFAGEFGAFGLDMIRWAETAVYNADEGNSVKKLYQPW